MKRVSLKAKVPGLCVLGALGATFLLSPLAAFAGCGGGQQAAQNTLKMKSVEKFSECSNRPLSSTQLNSAKQDNWLDKPATTQSAKATVGNAAGVTTAPAPAPEPKPFTPQELKAISFLAGNASCSFSSVDQGAKINLNNGDVFLATLSSKTVANQPVFGMLVGGKLVLFTSDATGNHFSNLVQNPNVKKGNFTLNAPGTTPATTAATTPSK